MPIIKNKAVRAFIGKGITHFVHRFMRSPVSAAHQEYTMVYSQHDNPGKPNDRLIDLTLKAATLAQNIDLTFLKSRTSWTYPDPTEFPGEHYKLLAALIKILQPKVIIEIGTERGMSCLAMKSALSPGSKIHTFDIKRWSEMESPVLIEEDFDESLEQHLSDLTDDKNQEQFRSLFEKADFIFMDAAKDGNMENIFLAYFRQINFKNSPILLVDDIHNWNMLSIWRGIEFPKMDVTSFGHFTGTGLVAL